MPFYFSEVDVVSKVDKVKSVLLLPCRFCPAASTAVHHHKPYFRFFRNLLKTAPYEKYLRSVKTDLQKKGVRTKIYKTFRAPRFIVCMWTSKSRDSIRKLAKNYESIVVFGCEAAVRTIIDSADLESDKVIQGVKTEGLMSVIPEFSLPGNISLKVQSKTKVSMNTDYKLA